MDFVDNFGITYLSAVAKQTGWNTHLTVFSPRTIDRVMLAVRPELVCYSAMSSDADIYLRINRLIKSKYNVTTIMGGPHATFFPEVIEDEHLDFICQGEGEPAFEEFLGTFKKGGNCHAIANFCSKTQKNDIRPLVENLDSLPMPDRDIVFQATELGASPLKTFMTSRGCPYACSYCHNAAFQELYRRKGKVYRTHSPRRIVEEIKVIRGRYPLKFIKFEDDMFAASLPWLDEFSRIYAQEIGIPFNCLQRMEYVTEERVRLIKAAGGVSISASIDSANERIREELLNRNMRLDNAEIRDRIRIIKRAGLNILTNTIFGIPTSTLEDEYEALRLGIDSGVDFASATILAPFPRTPIWRYCKEHNLLEENAEVQMKSVQARSLLTCFTEKEKDIQWNLSVFFPAIVKFPLLRWLLLWIARKSKSRSIYSGVFILCKSYMYSRYIFPFRGSWLAKVKFLKKAWRLEGGRILGIPGDVG